MKDFKNLTLEEKEDWALLILMQQADRNDTVARKKYLKY